jgi:hypothetical protein
MKTKWITLREANAFIIKHHRHHGKVQGAIFALGCYIGEQLIGVATLGRPLSRRYNQQEVCEITRLCTNGTENACSKLYGALARIAKEMGFKKVLTYIGADESGASLKASGWDIIEIEIDVTKTPVEWKRNNGNRNRIVRTLFGEIEKYPAKATKRCERLLEK